ncbi:C-type lectin domain family 4 member F-like [Haliotis cracherodii]|uniref:C-type lectin domain family 4 member F-like n=1 Tax=Haliotis cracherodii TaxID=6455 RepID=UPI0039ED963F
MQVVMALAVVFLCILLAGSLSGLILPMSKPDGTADMSSLLSHVSLLEQNMAILQTTTAQLQTDLQVTRTELENTQTELQSTMTDLQTSKTQQEVAKAEIQSLKDGVETLEAKLKSSSEELVAIKTELKYMPHGNIHGDVPLNLTLLDVISHDVKLNTAQINTLQADVLMMKNNLSLTSSEVSSLQSNMSDVENQTLDNKWSLRQLSQMTATKIQGVAFQAHDPPSHAPAKTPLQFTLINHNAGSGFNIHTGKFTAPVNGTYMFWTQLEMGGGSNTALYVYIKKTGGVNMAAGYMETGSSIGDVDTSAQTIDHLEAGEQVWVEITNNYDIYHSASYFGGALLSVV